LSNTVGRERRILRARYQLVDAASGDILLDATAGSDAGLDVVSSEYATVAAEQTALENLTRWWPGASSPIWPSSCARGDEGHPARFRIHGAQSGAEHADILSLRHR
jgi:hypothetical protein